MDPVVVASVPYVNARPLTWGLDSGPYRTIYDVRRVPPSEIPDLLRDGRVDAGLIPSIECLRLDNVEILPDLCIASRGAARSVLLVSRPPIERVRRIAVDVSSRTSVALLQILLERRGRRDVVFEPRPPSLPAMLGDCDAGLIIGDPALSADTTGLRVFDLGAEWRSLTGLPFVFALWAVRRDAPLPEGARPFLESRRLGVANIRRIARAAAPRLRLEADALEAYLRTNLHYRLGPEETRGLESFLRRAAGLGLAPAGRRVRLLEPDERPPAPPPEARERFAHE
jgi:chorismate dehydratase